MGRDPASRPDGLQTTEPPTNRPSRGYRPATRSHPRASVPQPASFAGHYGQLIVSEGIAPIPRVLYLYQRALGLSPQQVWFVSCVLARKWDGALPHPRLQELARNATLGLRQIKKIKNSLVHAGLLEVSPRFGSEGEQDANSYDFGPLFDRLEQLVLADPAHMPDELAEHPASLEAQGAAEGSAHGPPSAPSAPSATVTQALPDRSFAARFGRVILRRGISAIPRALFTYQADLGLSPQQMWFIGYILSFQWSTELPYPSLRKMAQNTGYSERQIHRIKDSLVLSGYLRVVERQGADGRDTTSAYDFTELLEALTALIREQAGGELGVSGGVNGTSVEGERGDSGRVNPVSEGGVNCMSVGRVNPVSYRIESIKEESDKEEPHQQQPGQSEKIDESEEAQETAYYALVDVGVFPSTALEITQQLDSDVIIGWVRYYLSVLSEQSNLSNPLGVLVSRLRSGEEAPYVPSSGDLHSLRLQYSRYR